MLTADEKEYYKKIIKQYKFISKAALIFTIIPVGALLYFIKTYKGGWESLISLGFSIALTLVSYERYLSFKMHAGILNVIANKPGFEKPSEPEKKT
jgi:hypothetical protein